MKLTDEELADLRVALGAMPDERLWAMNARAAELFLAGSTQWRMTIAVREGQLVPLAVGLDYPAVLAAAGVMGIVPTADAWWGLRVMEAAAIATLNGAP